MSGFNGILNFSRNIKVEKQKILKMQYILNHRGPDINSTVIMNNFGIGFLGLNYKKHQDLNNLKEYNNFIIAIDGEIYNKEEILKNLNLLKAYNRSINTAELIYKSYIKWGNECFEKFNGNFSIVIFNKNKNELIIVRDRFGSKPLYYYNDNGQVIFSSEIKGILSVIRTPKVNMIAVHEYLSERYTVGEDTLFENIYKVMNNQICIFSNHTITKEKLWEFPEKISNLSESEIINIIDDAVIDSVVSKTEGVDDIGLLLSSGVDSSTLVPIIQKHSKAKIHAITADFTNNTDFDESNFAREFAQKIEIDHEVLNISSDDYIRNISQVIRSKDSPTCINSEIAIYLIAKHFKTKKINVLLGGDNADSIFAPAHDDIKLRKRFKKVSLLRKFILVKVIIKIFFSATTGITKKGFGKRSVFLCKNDEYWFWNHFPIETSNLLYKNCYIHFLIQNKRTREKLRRYFKNLNSKNFKKLYFLYHHDHYAVTNILRAVNTSIFNSLIYIMPYLDNRLLQISRSIPYKYINHSLFGLKFIFKKWAEKYLPKSMIYNKNKFAFNVPFNYWLINEPDFANSIRKELLKTNGFVSSFMDVNKLEKFIDNCIVNNSIGQANYLWRIYNLEIWHNIYFKK